MKLGVPIWNDRISPVFDTAGQILVIELKHGGSVGREIVQVQNIPAVNRGALLAGVGVGTVICGAISSPQEAVLRAAGIDVIPWIRGDVEAVIAAYCTGGLDEENFRLPGCRGSRHRRRGRRGNNRKGSGRHKRYMKG